MAIITKFYIGVLAKRVFNLRGTLNYVAENYEIYYSEGFDVPIVEKIHA